MKRIISLCISAGMVTCAAAAPDPDAPSPIPMPDPALAAQWTIRGHIPPEKFVIQSHRGAGELAPGNTLEAFELCQKGILYQSLPWGVAEPKVYWQLLDLGVASFATDHPDVTLKAVRDYYAVARP